jgi:hypothetical protein
LYFAEVLSEFSVSCLCRILYIALGGFGTLQEVIEDTE